MRIAQIATLNRPVPPKGEGSVELLVSLITEELVRRGHDVTLFALPSSKTNARLISPVPRSYSEDSSLWDWQLYENFQVREAFMHWQDFDVIHCHSYHFGLLYCDFVPIPSLHSFHIEPGPDYVFLATATRNRHLLFCSQYQSREFSGIAGVHVIPHGLDLSDYRPLPTGEREGYLAFLGRFTPGKGADLAIQAAKKSGIPLRLAAPPNAYFHEVIAPQLIPGFIDYLGPLSGEKKADFLARASALLYPVRDAEPFGLVLVEAMASGTPVIAFDRGGVLEIIEHKRTGWISDTDEDFMVGIESVSIFDPMKISAEAHRRFDYRIMVDAMENLLLRLHKGEDE